VLSIGWSNQPAVLVVLPLVGRKRLWRIVLRKIGALKFFLGLKPELHFAACRFAILFPELVRAISNLLVCWMCHLDPHSSMLRDAFLSDYQLPDVRLNAPPRGLFGDKDGAAPGRAALCFSRVGDAALRAVIPVRR
jgi:hypothetical protein